MVWTAVVIRSFGTVCTAVLRKEIVLRPEKKTI